MRAGISRAITLKGPQQRHLAAILCGLAPDLGIKDAIDHPLDLILIILRRVGPQAPTEDEIVAAILFTRVETKEEAIAIIRGQVDELSGGQTAPY